MPLFGETNNFNLKNLYSHMHECRSATLPRGSEPYTLKK